MKLWRFEGTTEEFNSVSEALIGTHTQGNEQIEIAEPAPTVSEANRFATVQEAFEILSRRELSKNMEEVLRALYEAGTTRLTSDALKGINGHDSNQFRGLMGAFGRRSAHTLPAGVRFWDYHWDQSQGQYLWTLPESVREAMKQLKLV